MRSMEKRIKSLEDRIRADEAHDPRFEGPVLIVPGTNPTDDELETAKVECLQERQPYRWRRGEPVPGCALILRDGEGVVRALCAVDRCERGIEARQA